VSNTNVTHLFPLCSTNLHGFLVWMVVVRERRLEGERVGMVRWRGGVWVGEWEGGTQRHFGLWFIINRYRPRDCKPLYLYRLLVHDRIRERMY